MDEILNNLVPLDFEEIVRKKEEISRKIEDERLNNMTENEKAYEIVENSYGLEKEIYNIFEENNDIEYVKYNNKFKNIVYEIQSNLRDQIMDFTNDIYSQIEDNIEENNKSMIIEIIRAVIVDEINGL